MQINYDKKSRIRETKHLSTDADRRIYTKKNSASEVKFKEEKNFFCAAILHSL